MSFLSEQASSVKSFVVKRCKVQRANCSCIHNVKRVSTREDVCSYVPLIEKKTVPNTRKLKYCTENPKKIGISSYCIILLYLMD